MVSVERLSNFLNSAELQADARTILPPPPPSGESSVGIKTALERGDTVLSIRGGEFRWSKDAVESTLEDINLEVKTGELLGVLGRVGAGKVSTFSGQLNIRRVSDWLSTFQSSLLSAVIGEMTRSEGAVELYGSIAYAPQNPWIMSTTVRDNITFYRHFDEDFYNAVIDGTH